MTLFINACVRSDSRTKRLADCLLSWWDDPVEEVRLAEVCLPKVDEAFLAKRDRLIAAERFEDSMFDYARQFAAADRIVIAAPYWDLSFPAALKQYLEQINVLGITFLYTPEGYPKGLCKAKELYYVATAGGSYVPEEFGFGYVKALAQNFYGIPKVKQFFVGGLDVAGAYVERLLQDGMAAILNDEDAPEVLPFEGNAPEDSENGTVEEGAGPDRKGGSVMRSLTIQKIGVTKLAADAVVNAANDALREGTGVCGAIFRDAGSTEMTAACRAIGHCDTGSAVITPGFRLPAKYVIHAVGPVYRDGRHGEPALLRGAYRKSLELCVEHDLHSIGFPLISSGLFGYPVEQAWEVAIRACKEFFKDYPDYEMDIIFAVLEDERKIMGERILNEIGVFEE